MNMVWHNDIALKIKVTPFFIKQDCIYSYHSSIFRFKGLNPFVCHHCNEMIAFIVFLLFGVRVRRPASTRFWIQIHFLIDTLRAMRCA